MTKTTRAKAATAVKTTSAAKSPTSTKQPTRLDQLQDLLMRSNGASIAEMMEATGWQSHSVRGAMAGALKKRGLSITSQKVADVRRYHAAVAA